MMDEKLISKLSEEQVLAIVDICFRYFASNYRTEATQMAQYLFKQYQDQETGVNEFKNTHGAILNED